VRGGLGIEIGGGGAGYGGIGGDGSLNGGSGGSCYGGSCAGLAPEPVDVGSGGGGVDGGNGGNGGGAIKLVVKGTLLVDGNLSANGTDGGNGGSVNASGGGGSGGSILVYTGQFDGTGTISANGGNSGGKKEKGGNGGGGRIALYYFNKDFTGVPSVVAGTGGGAPGGTGSFTEGNYGNTNGWAFSSNIGWVSFNCYNDMNLATPEIDHTCDTNRYGVTVNAATGEFTGYAFSSNIGWIKFNPTTAPPAAPFYSACLDQPGVAEFDCDGVGDYTVSGWARACTAVANKVTCEGPVDPLSGGWDGWIKMSAAPAYGVNLDTSSSPPGLTDFAWGSDVIGWLNFDSTIPGSGVFVDIPAGTPTALFECEVIPPGGVFTSPPCTAWNTELLTLKNRSTDPDGPSSGEIIRTEWDILLPGSPPLPWGGDPDVACPPSGPAWPCDLTIPVIAPDTYTVELYVEDNSGQSDTFFGNITIKRDIAPAMECSLDGIVWGSCSAINIVAGEIIFFRDISVASEDAFIGIDDALTVWTFISGSPGGASGVDSTSTTFITIGDNDVTLSVTDDASPGRSRTVVVTITINVGFPDWREVTPF